MRGAGGAEGVRKSTRIKDVAAPALMASCAHQREADNNGLRHSARRENRAEA